MSKLLQSGFSRLFTNKAYWITTILFCVLCIVIILACKIGNPFAPTIDKIFLLYIGFEGFFFALFMSLFIGTDYSDGTIRNKIIVGHKRNDIYLSNFIICFIGANIMNLACMLTMLGFGIPYLGVNLDNSSDCLEGAIVNIFLIGAFTAIFTLISMITKSKTNAIVVSIFAFFFILYGSSAAYQTLKADGLSVGGISTSFTVNGEEILPEAQNTLTGVKRRIVELITEISPGGQSLRITENDLTGLMPLYSFAVMIVVTATGTAVFRRKDLI